MRSKEFIRENTDIEQMFQNASLEQLEREIAASKRLLDRSSDSDREWGENRLKELEAFYALRKKAHEEGSADDKIRQIAEIINRDCQPFLKQSNQDDPDEILWRGIKGINDSYFGKKIARLNNRKPKDSGQDDHELMNDFFEQNYGHPYRNGVFATGSQGETATYGTSCSIYPIGDFDFIWSPIVMDIYGELLDNQHSEAWEDTFAAIQEYDPEIESEYVNIADVLEHMGKYQTTDLSAGMNSMHEVMIWCKEYYFVNVNVTHQVRKLLQ